MIRDFFESGCAKVESRRSCSLCETEAEVDGVEEKDLLPLPGEYGSVLDS